MKKLLKTETVSTDPRGCQLLEFPAFTDRRGTLSFVEQGRHIPFDIRRIFYLYDVPADEMRASHALRKCHQCLIAMAGKFDVLLDDGFVQKTYHLDQPNLGLYVPPMVWREVLNFSPGAVCVVLASEFYDPADYFEDLANFLKTVRTNPQ